MQLSAADKIKYEQAVTSNDLRSAGVIMSELYAKYPENFDVLLSLGGMLTSVQEYNKAIPILMKAAEINRDNAGLFYSLGLAFAGSGDEDRGLAFIDHAISFKNIQPRLQQECLILRACVLIKQLQKDRSLDKNKAIETCLLCSRRGYPLPPLVTSFITAHNL